MIVDAIVIPEEVFHEKIILDHGDGVLFQEGIDHRHAVRHELCLEVSSTYRWRMDKNHGGSGGWLRLAGGWVKIVFIFALWEFLCGHGRQNSPEKRGFPPLLKEIQGGFFGRGGSCARPEGQPPGSPLQPI